MSQSKRKLTKKPARGAGNSHKANNDRPKKAKKAKVIGIPRANITQGGKPLFKLKRRRGPRKITIFNQYGRHIYFCIVNGGITLGFENYGRDYDGRKYRMRLTETELKDRFIRRLHTWLGWYLRRK